MKALLFEGVPKLQEFDGAHTHLASGTNVYIDEVVKALTRHGTFDAHFYLWRAAFLPLPQDQAARLRDLDERAEIISPGEIERLDGFQDVVLFTPGPYLSNLLPLRSRPEAAHWLASGVTHSIDGRDIPYLVMTLAHSDVDAADSLICSSHAGRTVMQNLFDSVAGPEAPAASPEGARAGRLAQPSLPVVPLGIDCRAYSRPRREEARARMGLAADTSLILYVGRISPLSKCDLMPLLYAFGRALAAHPNSRLVIAGDDTQHSMAVLLRSAAAELGCGEAVTIRANIGEGEKVDLYAAADIFVSPSDNTQETFGLTIAEAMAAGLPVIASDWNGYKELVTHEETGFLVPTYWVPFGPDLDRLSSSSFLFRNSLLAVSTVVDVGWLEHYLRLLISRPEHRKALGEAGRRQALEKYDWSATIPAYESLWREGFARSRALRQGESSFGRCPSHYPVQEVFGHYPTRALTGEEALEITPEGRRILSDAGRAERLTSPNGITEIDCVKQLLQIVTELGPVTLAELAARLSAEGRVSRLAALTNIAFSLKYDFLKLGRPPQA